MKSFSSVQSLILMRKSSFFILLSLFFLHGLNSGTFAEEIRITANNLEIRNANQKNINGVLHIPLRSFFEALEWKVGWDSQTKEVTCLSVNEEIIFKTGSKEIRIDGRFELMEIPLTVINDKSYVPQKFITNHFGIKVRWNKKDNIIVTSDQNASSVTVNGGSNIVIVGDCIIVNIFEPCSINTLNDMISYSDRLLTSGSTQEALVQYKKILENVSCQEAPDIYAQVTNNIANAYSKLAEYTDSRDNISKAIELYERAAPFYRDNNDTSNYSIILNNLGSAYLVLADITGNENFWIKAITSYNEALKFFNKFEYPLDYALIQYNLAKAYSGLGFAGYAIECCINSEDVLKKALDTYNLDQFPSFYAVIQYNIGDIILLLGSLNNYEKRIPEAELFFEESIKVWNVESYPLNYAKANRQIGLMYLRLYEKTSDFEYLNKSEKLFEEALKFYTLERFPFKNASVNYDLGNVKMLLAQFHNNDSYLSEATLAFENCLKVFNPVDYPKHYNHTLSAIEKLK